MTLERRTLGAVLMLVGGLLAAVVMCSGLIDRQGARMIAFVCVLVAVGLFATGAALREWHTGGPTS